MRASGLKSLVPILMISILIACKSGPAHPEEGPDEEPTHIAQQALPDDSTPWVWPPPPPEPENERDAMCRALDSRGCAAEPLCRAAEGASWCGPEGGCTEDVSFHYCMAISDEQIVGHDATRELCTSTGGSWRAGSDPSSSSCTCPPTDDISSGPRSFYWRGCSTLRDLCEGHGGEWRRLENVRSFEVDYITSASDCVPDYRNSRSWDPAAGRCTVTSDGFTCYINGAEIWNEQVLYSEP